MTSAEYRTLREACGLSQRDAAEFHNVATRTIVHWETGRNNVPDGACEELRELNATIERGVTNGLPTIREAAGTREPDTIALIRYRTSAEYAGSRAARQGLPYPCHNAMLARTMTALGREGIPVTIAWA